MNQSTLYAGYPWRFQHFRKTFGYANMPLDGLWLRAPYLHNGSVPTLRDLLEPARSGRQSLLSRQRRLRPGEGRLRVERPPRTSGRQFFKYDTTPCPATPTRARGRGLRNQLPAADKDALVEYLKTF